MSQSHNPSDSATGTMRRYETNTDQGDSAPTSNNPEPEAVPATEPLPEVSKHDNDPIPMSDRQSPWQSEKGSEAEAFTNESTEGTGNDTKSDTEAKEGDPEVRTV